MTAAKVAEFASALGDDNPRYAVRELMYMDLYPPSSPQQTLSGTEYRGNIGRIEDYLEVPELLAAGGADFLLRVEDEERPSIWGPYHYEVADTKLARHVKGSAVLQICSYIDQLEGIQGVRPEWLYVALGGSARTVERLRRRVGFEHVQIPLNGRNFLALAQLSDAVVIPPGGTRG